MPSPNVSSPSDSTRLRLSHILSAIAILAFAFAFLFECLSLALAVSVVGILTLEGLRVPRITDGVGMRRWLPWVFWSLILAPCPVAIYFIGIVYEHKGPPLFNGPRPWAAQVVDILCIVHLGVSVVAAISVVLLAKGGYRWLAWAAILVIDLYTALLALYAVMSTTGVYL